MADFLITLCAVIFILPGAALLVTTAFANAAYGLVKLKEYRSSGKEVSKDAH